MALIWSATEWMESRYSRTLTRNYDKYAAKYGNENLRHVNVDELPSLQHNGIYLLWHD